MADQKFAIPSLLTPGAWEMTVSGTAVAVVPLLKRWVADNLINKVPSVPNSHTEPVGRYFSVTVVPENCRIRLQHRIDWWALDGTSGLSVPEPLPDWNLWHTSSNRHLDAGLFAGSDGKLWFQLKPWAEAFQKGQGEPLPALPGLRGRSFLSPSDTWPARWVALFHPLQQPGSWHALMRAPFGGQALDDVSATTPLVAAVNAASRAARGTRTSSQPFTGVTPFLEAIDAFSPITHLELGQPTDRAGQRSWAPVVRRIVLGASALGANHKGKRIRVHLDWSVAARDGGDAAAAAGMRLTWIGVIDETVWPEQFKPIWTDDGVQLTQVFEVVRKLVPARPGSPKQQEPDVVLDLGLRCESLQLPDGAVEPGWIRFGSMQIRPSSSARPRMRIRLRGEWSHDRLDLYPECTLQDLECEFRESAGGDPLPSVASSAAMETPPIVGLPPGRARVGKLEVVTTYARGRDAVTEMTLVESQQPLKDQPVPKAFWLNLRPFMYGHLRLEGGWMPGRKFTWRSDDEQGAQWRTDTPGIEVTLPPQAVGEEMERGKRFWSGDASTIGLDLPVKYRFSRPTYLHLMPSPEGENRKYERQPLNFRQLMRGVDISRMVTEMAYPLQITYERRAGSDRRLMLTELGEFYGKPPPALYEDARDLPEGLRPEFAAARDEIAKLAGRQVAAQYSFVHRIAELYVHDPKRHRADLQLKSEVRYELRDVSRGAAALSNPLPTGMDMPAEDRARIGRFLANGAWGKPEDGSIRVGLLHSIEMPSDLIEILETPEAVEGVVESLTLSALGATGKMHAAFARGKASFAVEVAHGQVSRLVKTRVGRIGALWNRAKHVIVYERSAAPSAQFRREQCAVGPAGAVTCEGEPMNGWPILRKMEEYIEPIEPDREFARERDAEFSDWGFLDASVFVTPRIYVNGAWARDLGDGYEVPLWDPVAAQQDPAFYPRPRIHLRCWGQGQKWSRLWFQEPQNLYFYADTSKATDADTDAWRARMLVDFDNAPRLPVMEKRPAGDAMGSAPSADPGLCTSRRFDLLVDADGPVDLQHGRGSSEPVLARLTRVWVGRTSQRTPVPDETIAAQAPAVTAAIAVASAASLVEQRTRTLAADLASFRQTILGSIPAGNIDCTAVAARVRREIQSEATRMRGSLALNATEAAALLTKPAESWKAAINAAADDLVRRGFVPSMNLQVAVQAARDRVSGVAARIPDAGSIPVALKAELQAVAGELLSLVADTTSRLTTQAGNSTNAAQLALQSARDAVSQAAKELKEQKIGPAAGRVAAAITQLDKVRPPFAEVVAPARALCKYLLEQLQAAEAAAAALEKVGTGLVAALCMELEDAAIALSTALERFEKYARETVKAGVDAAASGIDAAASAVRREAENLPDLAHPDKVRKALVDLSKALDPAAASGFLATYTTAVTTLRQKLTDGVDDVAATVQGQIGTAVGKCTRYLDERITQAEQALLLVVTQAQSGCEDLRKVLDSSLQGLEQWGQEQARATMSNLMSSEAAKRLQELAASATTAWDIGSQGISLARCIGDLPKIDPLRFDVATASYVYAHREKLIAMTPAIAQLRDAASPYLQSLGLATPHSGISGKMVLDKVQGLLLKQVMKTFSGINFATLAPNWRLPDLNSDNLRITHGVDERTHRAWVNARVLFEERARQDIFNFGALALYVQNTSFDAFTGVSVIASGETVTADAVKSTAMFKADWVLEGAGQPLVRFRKVTLQYDGVGGFGFDLDPANIEIHPGLKFVSDLMAAFKGSLPPAIQIEEERGRPIGASASTTSILVLPDMGAVKIGPIDMRSKLALLVQNGKFVVRSSFSLGNRESPVFVQLSFLGGGCWLEARADCIDGVVTPSVSVGLAVGSMRAINLSAIAQGSYSILLYCYIEISNRGTSIAIGLSVVGSARIVGFVNANVALLLEAHHENGKTEGTGRLDVSVKISWCFTFRFKHSVRHSF